MQKLLVLTVTILTFLAFGVVNAQANWTFGSGEYTNLCGSGTAANSYSCSQECNPNTGSCSASNPWVVKYICNGRQTECGGSGATPFIEYWGTSMSMDNPGCDKTVQIDVFKRQCKDTNGNWICGRDDVSGYLVWYSGACQQPQTVNTCKGTLSVDDLNSQLRGAGYPGPWDLASSVAAFNRAACPAVTATPIPTAVPTAVPTAIPTAGPTATPAPTVVPTVTPVQNQGGVLKCPDGFAAQVVGSTIVCVQVQQQQNQNQSVVAQGGNSSATGGSVNISYAAAAPQQVQAPVVQAPVVQALVQGVQVKELPKTGLPLGTAVLGGLIPAGYALKRLTRGVEENTDKPSFIWQLREFLRK